MNLKHIDIHSHLQDHNFDQDRDEVLARMLAGGVAAFVVGTDRKMSEDALTLARTRDDLSALIGLHPTDNELEVFDYEFYKKLGRDPKVVGIGECGLDYYRLDGSTNSANVIERQKKVFREHIRLADELGKPLMLHIRNDAGFSGNAYRDVLDILKEMNSKVRGDVHFFAGSIEDARAFLDYGFTLSFTGAATFPKSKKSGMADYEELIKFTPLDMILTETDCPYVAPIPHRGERNEPAHVRYVVRRIAEIKGLPEDEAATILLANARRVFKI